MPGAASPSLIFNHHSGLDNIHKYFCGPPKFVREEKCRVFLTEPRSQSIDTESNDQLEQILFKCTHSNR